MAVLISHGVTGNQIAGSPGTCSVPALATGWTQMTNPFPGGTSTAGTAVYAHADGSVYVGGDGGLYKSTDDGSSWTNVGDASWASGGHPQVGSIGVNSLGEIVCGVGKDPTSGGNNLGAWRLSSGVWSRCTNTAGGYINASDAVGITRVLDASGNMFAITGFNGDVWKSVDNGASFTKIAAAVGGTGGVSDGALQSFARDPTNGDLLTGGEIHAIYKSTDNGVNWTNFGLDTADGYKNNLLIITFNAINEPLAVRGDAGSGILFRYTSGAWTSSGSGIDAFATIRGLLLNQSSGVMYCSENRNSGPAGGDVFKSTNNGATWTQWSSGVDTTLPMRGIAIGPTGKMYLLSKSPTDILFYKTNGVAP